MIFHEIYGCYYQAVAQMIRAAIRHELTEQKMKEICDAVAFPESFLEILPPIQEQHWQLIKPDLTTPLQHDPTLPLTLLEKRWMKAITLDPRFKLFDVYIAGLDDVEPLFTPDDFVVFDRYNDGDPYDDPNYIRNFRTILTAIHKRRNLTVHYINRFGKELTFDCVPQAIEYSEKDDKFRVIRSAEHIRAFNIQRIKSCEMTTRRRAKYPLYGDESRRVLFELIDERNALERVMLHFAHFEKQVERLDEKQYRVTLNYDATDETELLIRILSFGPLLLVKEPDSFVQLVRDRLLKQKECLDL